MINTLTFFSSVSLIGLLISPLAQPIYLIKSSSLYFSASPFNFEPLFILFIMLLLTPKTLIIVLATSSLTGELDFFLGCSSTLVSSCSSITSSSKNYHIEELLEAIKCFGPVCYEFEDVEEYVAHLEIRQYSDEEIANMGDVF